MYSDGGTTTRPWTPVDEDRCLHQWTTSSGRTSRCPNAWTCTHCKRCNSQCLRRSGCIANLSSFHPFLGQPPDAVHLWPRKGGDRGELSSTRRTHVHLTAGCNREGHPRYTEASTLLSAGWDHATTADGAGDRTVPGPPTGMDIDNLREVGHRRHPCGQKTATAKCAPGQSTVLDDGDPALKRQCSQYSLLAGGADVGIASQKAACVGDDRVNCHLRATELRGTYGGVTVAAPASEDETGPPSRAESVGDSDLSGEDSNGETEAGWREPRREYYPYRDQIRVVVVTGHCSARASDTGCEEASFGNSCHFAPTWTTSDLAYTLPIVERLHPREWGLKMSENGLLLNVDGWTRIVRFTSDLFFSPWHNTKRWAWPELSQRARTVISRFLGLLDSSTVKLAFTEVAGVDGVFYNCPLPAPVEGEWRGLQRKPTVECEFWSGTVSSQRGVYGPPWLVKEVLVPDGTHSVGIRVRDSDRGRYEQGYMRYGSEVKESDWTVSRIEQPLLDLDIEVIAHREDLRDAEKRFLLIDRLEMSRHVICGKKYVLVGRDPGLAYCTSDPAGELSHQSPRSGFSYVSETPFRIPPGRITREMYQSIEESQRGVSIKITDCAIEGKLSVRGAVEALTDEDFYLPTTEDTGCAFHIYRNRWGGGHIVFEPVPFKMLRDVTVDSTKMPRYYAALSRESLQIAGGHIAKGDDHGTGYVSVMDDELIGGRKYEGPTEPGYQADYDGLRQDAPCNKCNHLNGTHLAVVCNECGTTVHKCSYVKAKKECGCLSTSCRCESGKPSLGPAL